MLSRPNFCCCCGERVERIEWHVWTSRKFCELCQTENVADIWLPRAALAVCLFIGLAGAGSLMTADSSRLDLTEGPVRLALERAKRLAAASPSEDTPVEVVAPQTGDVPEYEPEREVAAPARQAEEPAAFCGALTKKGTPCTRKVKGGGRCWQHKNTPEPGSGRPAVSDREGPKAESDPNENS